ncbi:MAG: hypothetical protein IKE46_07865 [Selenomonadaceae bacterium]|nr:hypothetical protein [Selenomonadaceae bacterium]MBR4384366.1 hypothetical protein [Selenomonadaceae bacterium]
MSKIIKLPLTPEQMEKMSTVSDKQIREAQDALFMYLINRINELEEKIAPPDEEE